MYSKPVPEEKKDAKYLERRKRNTDSTRKSREVKRILSNQIILRTNYLEQEHLALKDQIQQANAENAVLSRRLTEIRQICFALS